jgi:DNA-binding NarL/FixJ family response regulator
MTVRDYGGRGAGGLDMLFLSSYRTVIHFRVSVHANGVQGAFLSDVPGKHVLLIPGRELGWSEVRKGLRKLKEVSEIRTAASLPQAVELANSPKPDAIIMGPLVDGEMGLNCVAKLRQIIGPVAPIIVIAADFDVDLILKLGHLGITGYLLWLDLTTDSLCRCLAPAVIDGVMIGSQTVGRAAVAAAQHRVSPPVDLGVLTEVECTVLRWLSQGLTEPEIAAREFVSERSVRRTITSAKQKLGAPNLFALGMAFMRSQWHESL